MIVFESKRKRPRPISEYLFPGKTKLVEIGVRIPQPSNRIVNALSSKKLVEIDKNPISLFQRSAVVTVQRPEIPQELDG
jgi:hypothetical protein